MATEAKSKIYYCQIGGIKVAWRAKKTAYDNIASGLGVKEAADTDKELVFGANQPKPVVVQISVAGGGSYKRFCHPDKVTAVCFQKALNGKQINGKNINSVSTIGR